MSEFYTEAQRALQDAFGSRDLADRLENMIVTEALLDDQRAFIEARDCFFLATVDDAGFPSCSYKGGAVGFVRALNTQTLAFPSYDGNGMFMSLGNVAARSRIGMLFVDFENPQRLRARGEARLVRDGPLLDSYPGAQVVVTVAIDKIWQNCPRYVHRMQRLESAPHVPKADGTAKLALWKRIEGMQDVVGEADRLAAEAAGLISPAEYAERAARGEA